MGCATSKDESVQVAVKATWAKAAVLQNEAIANAVEEAVADARKEFEIEKANAVRRLEEELRLEAQKANEVATSNAAAIRRLEEELRLEIQKATEVAASKDAAVQAAVDATWTKANGLRKKAIANAGRVAVADARKEFEIEKANAVRRLEEELRLETQRAADLAASKDAAVQAAVQATLAKQNQAITSAVRTAALQPLALHWRLEAQKPTETVRQPGSDTQGTRVQTSEHKAIPRLMELDDLIEEALRSSAVKLINADRIRDGTIGTKISRRQDLEACERVQVVQMFETPEDAIKLLRGNGREIGSLTYGWASPDDPDPTGEYMRAVRRFLLSDLGSHVKAIFWDFASLSQRPRWESEDKLFAMALKVMADMYASVLGTTVMRHRAIPARPASIDGEVVVLGDDKATEAAVRSALEAHGALENVHRDEQGRWRARFASHADAERAVAAGPFEGATAIFTYHNARPYAARGWTSLESGVSTEGPARAAYLPGLKATLERLPPKLVEIDGEAPEAASEQYGGNEGMGPRIERVRSSIQDAFFSDTRGLDKALVVGLYNEFIVKIGNAMVISGEGVDVQYEGECDEAGDAEGRGKMQYSNGDVYEGEFRAGNKEGRGTYQYGNGDMYEGEWKAEKQEGRGTFRWANGNVYEGEWKAGIKHGHGTTRSANGDVYVGEYMAGRKDGRGTYRFASGNVHDGEWKADKPEGRGTFLWANGNVYEGEWKASLHEGRGTLRYANGNVYEGEFKAGKMDGRGAMLSGDGTVIHDGKWKAGKPVTTLLQSVTSRSMANLFTSTQAATSNSPHAATSNSPHASGGLESAGAPGWLVSWMPS